MNVVSELRGCLEADCKKTLYGLTASGFLNLVLGEVFFQIFVPSREMCCVLELAFSSLHISYSM